MSAFRHQNRLAHAGLPILSPAWTKVLLASLFLLGCAPQAVPYPQPGMAIWKDGAGGSIQGSAILKSGRSSYVRSCAGFDAYIVPITSDTTAFIRAHFSQLRNGYAPRASLQDALGSFVTNNGGGRVSCRDDGTFIFANVAPGRYYILANIEWLLRWAQEGGTVSTVADVGGTQTTIAIDVALNSQNGTSHGPP